MTARAFFSDRLGRLLLWPAAMAVTAAFLAATGTQGGVLVIVLAAWCLAFLAAQGFDYLKTRAHLKELQAVMDGLDEKYLFAACAPKPKDAYERELFDLARRSGKAMLEAVSDAQAAQREYREYVEDWVHEIKTPIPTGTPAANWTGSWAKSRTTWSGPSSTPGRRARKRTS